ncbi:DUF6171 family protein [Anaerocolumna sp. MB42-C2]|uniref:DUF6171 family protein n=1 Tax=Anaerocolumna sp. MB42-C2 TaxID=3070997 RepID=UPI003FA47184
MWKECIIILSQLNDELKTENIISDISEVIKNGGITYAEDIRTPEETYKYRLEQCKKCQYLLNGLCRLCGCFVEIRTAVITNYCPSKKVNW